MASSRSLSSVNPAATSLPTLAKSSNPTPEASAAPAPRPPAPAPTTNVTQPTPASAPPNQHPSTTQVIKSTPTANTSPYISQPAIQNAKDTSKPSKVSSDYAAAPQLPSASSTPTGSHAAPVWSAIFAVLAVIIALVASFILLRRRREKSRRLWDAQRMPASNFGKYEGEIIPERFGKYEGEIIPERFGKYEGEIIPERKGSIEATLAADLARLRNLDPKASMMSHPYDREFCKRSLDYSSNPVPPAGFKIARKPSLRIRDSVAMLRASPAGDADIADVSSSAPAYDAKEYVGDFSSKETLISSLPPTNLSVMFINS